MNEAEQAKAEKEKAVTAKAEAEAERNSIEVENKAKAERSAALDGEIADKQKKRDAELWRDQRTASSYCHLVM